MKDPWLKFYTSDWRSDPALRMCSMAARGLWIDLICLMHEATPYGHLLINGHSVTDTQLGALVGAPPDQITALLGELEAAGVFSRTRAGVIFSRKLTRLAKKAATARNNGRKGGNPRLGKQTENPALDNPHVKGGDMPQNPEARIQISKEEEEEGAREPQKPPDPEIWTPDLLHGEVMAAVGLKSGRIPEYWMPPAASIHVWRWHADLGLTPEQVIEVARASRKNHPDPPNGPKALDRPMKQLSAALAEKPMSPEPAKTHRTGAANARSTFDSALNAALNAAPVGASLIDRSRSDPFAKQRR